MLAILRVTTKRVTLAALLDKVSMKPYRIDEESSANSDVVDLHYDLFEADASPQGIQAVADRFKKKEDDLRLLVDSNSTLLLDLGVSIYEHEYSKNFDFSIDLLRILSVHDISLRLSLYRTAEDKS
jgi:hypothetical protein